MSCSAVIDLHCDTLTAAMDFTQCQDTLNNSRSAFALSRLPPDVRWCQCCAVFVPDGLSENEAWRYYGFHRNNFTRQLETFSLCALPCRTAEDIERAWKSGKTALMLTVENACFLGTGVNGVEELSRDGVVLVSLTWNGKNTLGAGHRAAGGLTSLGRAVVGALEDRGIILDVSHLNDNGLSDVLDIARRPFVATHSNARAVCPHPRNLTDGQLKELIARGCLMGLNYYSPFLRGDGAPGELNDLCRHADHILALGGGDCLALGSDFDGADLPPCLDSCEKVPALGSYLTRQFGIELAEKILWRNALTFFQKNLSGFH